MAVFALIIGLSPLIFSYVKYYKNISSPLRKQSETLAIKSYEEYRKIDGIGSTSVYPTELLSYVLNEANSYRIPRMMDDRFLMHTPFLPLLILLVLLFPVRWKSYQLWTLGFLALLAVGVHGPMARALWYVLPKMEIFRQWYHFADFLNLHLILLMLSSLLLFKRRTYAFPLIVGLTIVGGLWVGNRTFDKYRYWVQHDKIHYDYKTSDEFATALFSGDFKFQVNAIPKEMSPYSKMDLRPFAWRNANNLTTGADVTVKVFRSKFLLPMFLNTFGFFEIDRDSWLRASDRPPCK